MRLCTAISKFAIAVALATCISACGSTATLRQGKEIADTGKAFADSMQALADLTVDRVIDRSTSGLAKERAGGWKRLTEDDLVKAVDKERKRAMDEVTAIGLLKAHTEWLEEYFVKLSALVSDPSKEAYVAAGQELMSGAEALATQLQKGNFITSGHVSAEQQAAGASLAGMAGQWVQARAVREFLDSTAKRADAQLAVQQKALKKYGDLIAEVDDLANTKFYLDNVVEPYSNGFPKTLPYTGQATAAPALPTAWRNNFATEVKRTLVITQVEAAKKALVKLRENFRAFAEGRETLADSVGDWTQIRDGLTQAVKIHQYR